MNNFLKIFLIVILFVAGVLVGYFIGYRKPVVSSTTVTFTGDIQNVSTTTKEEVKNKPEVIPEVKSTSLQVFKFHNFHGQDLGTSGFEFEYPKDWKNDGQYFSPQKINYYDISSTDAPVYYDLISEDLIDTSDLKNQITTDKRNKSDSSLLINGVNFKKYDLIDYYYKHRVIIYVGPKINILGSSYYLVFRWEEKPLSVTVSGNDPKVFEQMVESLRFTK